MRQSDLAREVGVSVRTIQGWEARGLNEARASKALKIAEILKCNIKDLMEDE
jgi:DNA-binding XRE family transcriptional regulator